jgi:hypothetical protein
VMYNDCRAFDGFRLSAGNEAEPPLPKVALNELSKVPAKGNPA